MGLRVALFSMLLIWHRIMGFARGVVPVCWLAHLMCYSGKNIARMEVINIEDCTLVTIFCLGISNKLANIPEEIFLKYTFSSNAELSTKCIESGFCGI